MVKRIKASASFLKQEYIRTCQTVGAFLQAPNKTHIQCMLFILGVGILSCGLLETALAQATPGQNGYKYNDERISSSANAVLLYLEGSFGALVMVASGIGAILSAAFGQYRAALGLMVVAIGSFILRSLMSTFFNDTTIRQ